MAVCWGAEQNECHDNVVLCFVRQVICERNVFVCLTQHTHLPTVILSMGHTFTLYFLKSKSNSFKSIYHWKGQTVTWVTDPLLKYEAAKRVGKRLTDVLSLCLPTERTSERPMSSLLKLSPAWSLTESEYGLLALYSIRFSAFLIGWYLCTYSYHHLQIKTLFIHKTPPLTVHQSNGKGCLLWVTPGVMKQWLDRMECCAQHGI